ncbi:glycosyltransferase [Lactococcus nasutitermitis]|uniref:Glycosyltransferase n=1 Tax=Lactococcus nasutitermitis TaxID=1652957 RepID=A0ABV9JG04_9LACT|nr:glycosyltransferase [Lactococcus nasutitermitis]
MSNTYGSRSLKRERDNSEHIENLTTDGLEMEDTQSIPKRIPRSELTRKREHELVFSISSWAVYGIIALASFLLSFSFYTFPLFNNLATPEQSQALYSGFAMQQGLTPFNDFHGIGGSLFYLINWLGNITGNSIVLYLFELLALFASGVFAYHLALRQAEKHNAGIIIAIATLLAVAGLGRGGDAPTLFALPFTLWAVNFFENYFHREVRDEKFILFGIVGAVVFVISPLMSLFFVVSIIALFIYNVTHRRVGRGFYQALSSIFGILIVGYLTAYYALNAQTLYTSIEQSVLIPFSTLGIHGNFLLTLAKSVILILIFGLVTKFVHGIAQIKDGGEATVWYVCLLIGAVIMTITVVLAPSFDSSNFLAILPFVIVFSGRSLQTAVDEKRSLLLTYLQNNLFAPVLALLFVIAAPIAYNVLNHSTFSEERSIAQYVKENTTKKDKVFVLAADKNINLLSKRVASIDTVPSYYPLKYNQSFDSRMSETKDKYIVIEAGQKMPTSVHTVLQNNYKPVQANEKYFMIYQKK